MSLGFFLRLTVPKALRQKKTLLLCQLRHLAAADALSALSLSIAWVLNLCRRDVLLSRDTARWPCYLALGGFTFFGTVAMLVDVSIAAGLYAAVRSDMRSVRGLARWSPLIWVVAIAMWFPSYILKTSIDEAVVGGICFVSEVEKSFLNVEFSSSAVIVLVLYLAALVRVRGRAPSCVETRILRRVGLFILSYALVYAPMQYWSFGMMEGPSPSGWFAYVAHGSLPLKGILDAMSFFVLGIGSKIGMFGNAAEAGPTCASNFNVRFSLSGVDVQEIMSHWSICSIDADEAADMCSRAEPLQACVQDRNIIESALS